MSIDPQKKEICFRSHAMTKESKVNTPRKILGDGVLSFLYNLGLEAKVQSVSHIK